MPYFIPKEYVGTRYNEIYDGMTAVDSLIILQEFLGVSYLMKFFSQEEGHSHTEFREFVAKEAEKYEKKARIKSVYWKKKEILPAYLTLIFKHYVLGMALQIIVKRHWRELPKADPDCFPNAIPMLTALLWFRRREQELKQKIRQAVDAVMAEDVRNLYIYCIQALAIVRSVIHDQDAKECIREVHDAMIGGVVPMGAELEFSNLGNQACKERAPWRQKRDKRFHNFSHYHHFFLGDVSWRLGGYLDHHVRFRKHLPVPVGGGFFEYSLVSSDEKHQYTMPLTRDPGFLARYIDAVTYFCEDIEPHSMHVTFERLWKGEASPEYSDFVCLLMIGGDLGVDESGYVRERRLANEELMKLVKRHTHTSMLDRKSHLVNEFGFMRLFPNDEFMLPMIMALKGIHNHCELGLSRDNHFHRLYDWALKPVVPASEQIERFLEKVRLGLRKEEVYDEGLIEKVIANIKALLDETAAVIDQGS